jgi:hypothetical protein
MYAFSARLQQLHITGSAAAGSRHRFQDFTKQDFAKERRIYGHNLLASNADKACLCFVLVEAGMYCDQPSWCSLTDAFLFVSEDPGMDGPAAPTFVAHQRGLGIYLKILRLHSNLA